MTHHARSVCPLPDLPLVMVDKVNHSHCLPRLAGVLALTDTESLRYSSLRRSTEGRLDVHNSQATTSYHVFAVSLRVCYNRRRDLSTSHRTSYVERLEASVCRSDENTSICRHACNPCHDLSSRWHFGDLPRSLALP